MGEIFKQLIKKEEFLGIVTNNHVGVKTVFRLSERNHLKT